MKTQKLAVLAAVGLAALQQAAVGAILPVGTTADTGSSGTVLASITGAAAAFSSGDQSGSLTESVIRGDTFNPYGVNDLTFVFQVTESGSTYVQTLALNGFINPPITVAYNTATGLAPDSTASLLGGTLNFTFTTVGGIFTPHSSALLFVYTAVTTYGGTTANVIDDTTAKANIYAPVPEPSTIAAGALMLLPLGIGAVRCLRKDRTA